MDKQLYLMNRYQKDDNTIAYAFSEEIVLIKREFTAGNIAVLYEIILNIETEKVISKRKIEDSEMKVSEFDKMKKILTDDTKAENKVEWRIAHKNVSLEYFDNTDLLCLPSLEEEYIERFEGEEDYRTLENALFIINSCLTEKQQKRYVQCKFKGETTRSIAMKEGVSQRTIQDSIELSEKKIKIFLESAKIDLSKGPKKQLR